MTKLEMKAKLEEIASRKTFFENDDEEAEEIFNEWNNLVPEAERAGMTHSEMKEIWESVNWNF